MASLLHQDSNRFFQKLLRMFLFRLSERLAPNRLMSFCNNWYQVAVIDKGLTVSAFAGCSIPAKHSRVLNYGEGRVNSKMLFSEYYPDYFTATILECPPARTGREAVADFSDLGKECVECFFMEPKCF